jgi:hypothetical protein
MERFGLLEQYERVMSVMASRQATAEFNALLGVRSLARSEGITRALLMEMSVIEKIDVARVRGAAQRYTAPGLGEGLKIISEFFPDISEPKILDAFAMAGVVPELDLIARGSPNSRLMNERNMAELANLALAGQTDRVVEVVNKELDVIR